METTLNDTNCMNGESDGATMAQRPYHSKRPHKKSRLGCKNCKTRRVKCDERHPKCTACGLRREDCVYPTPPPICASASPRAAPASHPQSHSHSPSHFQDQCLSQYQSCSSLSTEAVSTITKSSIPKPDGQLSSPPSSPGSNEGFDQPSPTLLEEGSPVGLDVSALFPVPSSRRSRFGSTFGKLTSRPPGFDETDMKLLWFYTVKGFRAFSLNSSVDDVVKVQIPQHAFTSPFLMNSLLGLSALHMRYLNLEPIPKAKEIAYRTAAFSGYRRAFQEAKPETFPALLACSLFLCALASETFREADTKPLYILDWIIVWNGIALIRAKMTAETIWKSGLGLLFTRPRVDYSEGSKHIPSNLLFMVALLKEGDSEFPYQDAYYTTLKILGSLYTDLENGWSHILALRIITFLTFLPGSFVKAARRKLPRALVILAHWLVWAKLLAGAWWYEGISDCEIHNIHNYILGNHGGGEADYWSLLMRIPLAATLTSNRTEIGRLLLENQSWEFVERDDHELDITMASDMLAMASYNVK